MAKRAKSSARTPARRSKSGKEMPFGVKIISVLVYVMSFILLISGLALLFSAGVFLSSEDAVKVVSKMIEDVSGSTTISTQLATSLPYIIGFGGVLALALTLLFFFTARGLKEGKNWARVLVVILFSLWFIGAVADILRGDIIRNLPDAIIDGVVAGYLLFNRKVQDAFSK
jgi:hypothetical protein